MKLLILAWVTSLVVVVVGTLSYAQGRLPQPQILSGNDIGFRIDGTDISGRATGTWLVRYNGNWIETGGAGIRPVK